jgi:hypothetical protein
MQTDSGQTKSELPDKTRVAWKIIDVLAVYCLPAEKYRQEKIISIYSLAIP